MIGMSLSVRDAAKADYAVFARLFAELHVPDPILTSEQFEQRMLPNVVIGPVRSGASPAAIVPGLPVGAGPPAVVLVSASNPRSYP
jgi:hypothetical protein